MFLCRPYRIYDVVRGNLMTNHKLMPLCGVLVRWLLNADHPVRRHFKRSFPEPALSWRRELKSTRYRMRLRAVLRLFSRLFCFLGIFRRSRCTTTRPAGATGGSCKEPPGMAFDAASCSATAGMICLTGIGTGAGTDTRHAHSSNMAIATYLIGKALSVPSEACACCLSIHATFFHSILDVPYPVFLLFSS